MATLGSMERRCPAVLLEHTKVEEDYTTQPQFASEEMQHSASEQQNTLVETETHSVMEDGTALEVGARAVQMDREELEEVKLISPLEPRAEAAAVGEQREPRRQSSTTQQEN